MVDRCVCFEKTFVELKKTADETGAKTVEELQRHVDFGKNCGLCKPYVEIVLRTGQTTLPVIQSQ